MKRGRYSSAAYAALEANRLWPEVWLIAAHAGELEEPGAFVTFVLLRESLLVVRQTDGTIRAFHNVCQHRGARLCARPGGTADTFKCPYHHWEYGADGRLCNVPERQAFEESALEGVRLPEVACEEREGFVWVCLAETPPDFDAFVAPILPWLGALGAARWQVTGQTRSRVDANWKATFDVHNEALHLPSVHPQATAFVDIAGFRFDALGVHGLIRLPFAAPDPTRHPGDELNEGLLQLLGLHGVAADTLGTRAQARDAIYVSVAEAAAKRGLDVEFVGRDRIADVIQIDVFPNAMILVQLGAGNVALYRFTPDATHPDDPLRSVCDVVSFDWTGTQPRDRRIRRNEADASAVGEGTETKQDFAMLERLQLGLASGGYQGSILSRYEAAIAHIHAGITTLLEG